MSDIALTLDEAGLFQIGTDKSDLIHDEGLETAVIISLFSDRRISKDEIPFGEDSKRGWWGDAIPDVPGDAIGSRLWTLQREKKTIATLTKMEEAATESLAWMIEDGLTESVAVSASFLDNSVRLEVDLKKGASKNRFAFVWAGQSNKRA